MKLKETPEDFRVYEVQNLELSDTPQLFSYWRMRKRNYTTQDAAQRIADALKTTVRAIGWAGNKDKKAITEQWISIKGAAKDKMESLVLKDITLEFLGYRHEHLSLGVLQGNHFEIRVNDVNRVPKAMDKFLNLYGEQRFSTNNAEVGRAIVKRDFEKAVKLVMESSGRQEDRVRDSLREKPNDHIGALKQIPKRTLRMYVHSYQSKLWNELATEYEKNGVDKENVTIIGFDIEAMDDRVKIIMEREEIIDRDFIIKEIPELSSEGGMRKMYAEIKDFSIGELKDDSIVVEFTLGKGSYATECVKALFENS